MEKRCCLRRCGRQRSCRSVQSEREEQAPPAARGDVGRGEGSGAARRKATRGGDEAAAAWWRGGAGRTTAQGEKVPRSRLTRSGAEKAPREKERMEWRRRLGEVGRLQLGFGGIEVYICGLVWVCFYLGWLLICGPPGLGPTHHA
jgi:hypothetical protein